ncbi:MAG: hypothetical protein KAW89_01020 [Armatimonadetes bacterium]|nr:hypothetical protein [Armatimonadota bacterium]
MIRISDWFSKAWEIFTKSVGVHIVLALIVGLGSTLTIGILAGPLMCGWFYIILRQLREPDYEPQIGDIGKGFEVFGQSLLAWILILVGSVVVSFVVSVVPALGQLLSVAAGWAIAACVLFVFPLIIDRNTGAIDAIKLSFETIKPAFWGFFGFAVLISVISGIGAAICGVGWLVAGPVTTIAVAIAYRDNFEEASAIEMEAPAPPQPPVEPPPVVPPAAE